MKVLKSFEELKSFQVSAVTLGNFDGFHLGHRLLVSEMNRRKGEHGKSLLITFDPHPREVLTPGLKVPRLTLWEELMAKFTDFSVDLVLRLTFNEDLKNTSAKDFMERLWANSPFKALVVGHDFALGAGREGGALFLADWCEAKGVDFVQVPPLERFGGVVSSQRIRQLLLDGQMEEANLILGEPYSVSGLVQRGDGRGRALLFPTANLAVDPRKIKPSSGVYGGKVRVGSRNHLAVCNIGKRPTFKDDQEAVSIEVHILDFDGDLYDREIRFEILMRIRDEKKFSSKEELVAQIKCDVQEAKAKLVL